MECIVTRESVLERVRRLPEELLEEADLLLAELTPISDEEWLQTLEGAPFDDEPIKLKDMLRLNEEHERRAERRREKQAREQKAV